jgi:hypothetical protein
MARRSSTSGLEALSFFIVGGLAGAALGLLLAPESGEETRRLLGRRMRGLVGAEDEEDVDRGAVIFSNRPEPAADVEDPLKRGETLGDVASS